MDLEEKLYREELELASLWTRFFAFCIDNIILNFIFLLIHWDKFSPYLDNYSALVASMISVLWQMILLDLAYEIVFLAIYGATFGKMIFKIRIISVSLLDKPNLFYSSVRSFIKLLGKKLFYIPFLFVFFSPFRQTLHDFLGKTIVIKNA